MLPLKRILCSTDFSDSSFEAILVASELAEKYSAELIVTHVFQAPDTPMETVNTYKHEMEKTLINKLNEIIKVKVPKGFPTRCLVVMGNPGEQIVEVANNENVDLIVIATSGETGLKAGLKRLVFGSVAEKVIRDATQPVLSIRSSQQERE